MKRLLLTIPLLLSTTAIGPCNPIPIGDVDGGTDGPPGTGGASTDAGAEVPSGTQTGGASPDGGRGGAVSSTGGGSVASGGANGGGSVAGQGGASSGGRGGGGASGGAGAAGVLHPNCSAAGWTSESIFFVDQVPVDFGTQVDASGAVHLVTRALVSGLNSVAYTRFLQGGSFETPVMFGVDGAVAMPRVGIESTGRVHVAWTGWGANDNIYYRGADANGTLVNGAREQAVTGQMMAPLQVQAEGGTVLIVYAGPGTGNGGVALRRNGAWVSGPIPITGLVHASALESNGAAHLLFASASGVIHAVVQADATLTTEVLNPVVPTRVALAIDSTGRLHAAYAVGARSVYASRGAAGWNEEDVPQGAAPVSLRVDRSGNVHLVMLKDGVGLTHALRAAGTWTVESLGAPAGGLGLVSEDNDGTIHSVRALMPSATTVQYVRDRVCLPGDVIDAARTISQGAWRGRATPTAPSSRGFAATVYDPLRREVVLYGGTANYAPVNGGTPFSDPGTWTLPSAGGGWVSKTTATQPGARVMPGMTFDSGRGRVVLMGDSADTNIWEWDGAAWSSRAGTGAPPALTGRVELAYDSARAQVVVWTTDGLWDWNGATGAFVSRAAAPPSFVGAPSQREAALHFDAASGHVLGFSAAGTWEWDPVANTFANLNVTPPASSFIVQLGSAGYAAFDGRTMRTWRAGQTAWTAVASGTGPTPRSGDAVVWDPTRGAVVVFGGLDLAAPMLPGIRVYTDPASPFWTFYSNATDEWLPPSP